MKIYNSEREAGLAQLIEDNNSIAYCVGVDKFNVPKEDLMALANKLNIKNFDEEIFYPTKSVLVTTSWNRNDDVFGTLPTWRARNTPINTFTDINHDHDEIVGHITDTWVIDEAGNIISDDTQEDDLPEKFHIVNSAVIYKFPRSRSKKAVARAEKLIAEIESGEKFVSMECLFPDFDYAVISPENKYYVVGRNEDTSFLTKHLRIYGGEGVYNNYRIGRFLKNMVFSGKGYVDKPANPESIIFDKDVEFNFAQSNFQEKWFDVKDKILHLGVKLSIALDNDVNTETLNMPTEENVQLQTQLKEALAKIVDLEKQVSEASVEKFKTEIEELKSELGLAKDESTSVAEKLGAVEADLIVAKTELETLKKTNDELLAQAEEQAAAEVRRSRIAILTEGGVEKDDAEKKVETFTNLSEEQFTVVANEILAAVAARKVAVVEEPEVVVAEENLEVVLEEVTPTNDGANAGALEHSETEQHEAQAQAEALRNNIANYLAANMSKKVKFTKETK